MVAGGIVQAHRIGGRVLFRSDDVRKLLENSDGSVMCDRKGARLWLLYTFKRTLLKQGERHTLKEVQEMIGHDDTRSTDRDAYLAGLRFRHRQEGLAQHFSGTENEK
jgi:hypothetical protein